MGKIKFSSFYIGGRPEHPTCCPDLRISDSSDIALGNTVKGFEMSWVRLGDIFVATKCACSGISWGDLNKYGYIFGYPVNVDGKPYLCRSLRVGTKKGQPNEWNVCLDTYGDHVDFWQWKQYFWGQEISPDNYADRIVRGGWTARQRDAFSSTTRAASIGFRPVLEPLDPMPEDVSCFLGKRVWVYGSQNSRACGVLTSIDDYDLVLSEARGPFPDSGGQWVQSNGTVAIMARSSLIWMKEK